MAKRQELLEIQQRQQMERKQQQEKLKSKIKKEEPSIEQVKANLEGLDWKETILYTDCVVQRININFFIDEPGTYLKEEDIDGLTMKVRRKK